MACRAADMQIQLQSRALPECAGYGAKLGIDKWR